MPSPFAVHWTLDPDVVFLNHGSFGATPRPVLDAQQHWRARMEAEPVRFFAKDVEPALDEAREVLARFVGARAEDLAFVPNATAGFNAVLRSLHLRPRDELLTTNHAYNAAKNAMEHVAAVAGARVIVADVPFPGTTPDAIVEAVVERVTPRTRLALLDHVTSATAVIFPIARLVAELERRGVAVLVDGAHAPGMLDLDVAAIGASYYTGNLHKWVCAPKGAGFLWVRGDRQPGLVPVALSHGANSPRTDRSRFWLLFDWTGTADPSAYLAVPEAIAFGAGLEPGGWATLRQRNHALALAARDRLATVTGDGPDVDDDMLGSMVSLPLRQTSEPGGVQGVDLYADPLHAALQRERIQVMVTPWPQRPEGRPWRRLVRVSVAPYTAMEDVERLVAALPAAIAEVADPAHAGGVAV